MFSKEIIGIYKNEAKKYYILYLAYHQEHIEGYGSESVYVPFSLCPRPLAIGDKIVLHRDNKGYLKGVEIYE